MFDLFEKFMKDRDYFGAGSILTLVGNLLTPAADPHPPGFYNAQVRVVPMDDCVHIFVACDTRETFDSLPGSIPIADDGQGVRLYSKRLNLHNVTDTEHRPMIIHAIYTVMVESLAPDAQLDTAGALT